MRQFRADTFNYRVRPAKILNERQVLGIAKMMSRGEEIVKTIKVGFVAFCAKWFKEEGAAGGGQ